MPGIQALHQALDLASSPLLAGAIRVQPIPDDVLSLIQVAAGDELAVTQAVAATGARRERVREAAVLYLQHVVFAPNADHYRLLGAHPDAPHATLREHVGWLMKWLHPDRAENEWESVFTQRVLGAWNELKTPQKRAQYDSTLPAAVAAPVAPSGKRRALVRTPRGLPLIPRRPRRSPKAWFALAAGSVVAGALVATVIIAPWHKPSPGPAADNPPGITVDGGF